MSSWINLSSPKPHRISAPLTTRWQLDPGLGYMDLSPFSDGHVVVVAAGCYLAGLRLDDGIMVWQRQLPNRVIDLAATRQGPVAAHDQDNQAYLTAFSWGGEERWRIPAGYGVGDHSLRGLEDHILSLGMSLEPGSRPQCRLINAESGDIKGEYPNDGDVPDVVPRGLVTSVRSTDPTLSGLFLYDILEKRIIRLLHDSNSVRAVFESIAVVDTYDVGVSQSQLIAVDTDGGQVLWTSDGGPNMILATNGNQLASVTAITPASFAANLRDLRSGRIVWRSSEIEGRYGTVMLTAEAVLVFADAARLHLFDRATGVELQTLAEPSTLVYGACLTKDYLIDICAYEVRCLEGHTYEPSVPLDR